MHETPIPSGVLRRDGGRYVTLRRSAIRAFTSKLMIDASRLCLFVYVVYLINTIYCFSCKGDFNWPIRKVYSAPESCSRRDHQDLPLPSERSQEQIIIEQFAHFFDGAYYPYYWRNTLLRVYL